ncbi:divergent serine/threonine protein kinase [Golden Marseillevirus]|uniref:divergent serine/threonine protein kinase n=1 Tax=Golden Marseillevirus TaxID=1720526 RepID=UPI000877AD33|nr:divergent serine/threonine protein kinase [Golden Marseillevirus]ALX27598.1 divergent serine/threonine protein kinase [Golden Marseillevirus]
MSSVIELYAHGQTFTFSGEDIHEAQDKLDEWVGQEIERLTPREMKDEYLKVVRVYEQTKDHPETEFYKFLKGTGLCPRLLRQGLVFSFTVYYPDMHYELDHSVVFLGVKRYGKSLEQIYGNPGEFMNSSFDMLRDKKLFDLTFPPSIFPQNVRKEVFLLARKLQKLGFEHKDFHAGNVLFDEKTQRYKVIDFEGAEVYCA